MSIDTATGKEAPAELSSERVKDIFATIAKKYERFNAVSSFGAYKAWLAGMMRQASIGPDDDVLDVAGGTGDVAFTVARAKHPRHIQCTDLVNEMLDVARAHYADGAADGVPVDFEVVDAQNIPYADATYDVITMAYGSATCRIDRVHSLRCCASLSRADHWYALSFRHRQTACGAHCTTFTSSTSFRFGAVLSRAIGKVSCIWRVLSRRFPTSRDLPR